MRLRAWLKALALGTMLSVAMPAEAHAGPLVGAVAAFAATPLGGILVNLGLTVVTSFGASLLKNLFGGNNKPKSNLAMRLSVATGGVVPQSFIVGHWATSGSLNYRGSWGEANGTPNAFYVEERVISDVSLTLSGFAYGEQKATILWDDPTEMGFPVLEARRNGVDHLWIRWRNGDDVVDADPYLRAKFGDHPTRPYTEDMIGAGRAVAIVTRKVPNEDNRDLFPANLEYRFETHGIDLYDLSKDSSAGGFGPHRWHDPSTWEPSSNPAVQIYNILRGITAGGDWLYGLQGLHPSRLPASSWIAAINEANVPTAKADGSSEPQFRTGAEIAVELEPAGVIEKLLAGCSGRIAEIGGIYKILIGAPGAAVMSFTDADIVVTKEQGYSPFPRIEQTYNGVRAKYIEPAANWELKDAPAYYSAEHEAEDGGRRMVADVTLETVTSNTQVQRLVKTAAEEQRRWRRHRQGLKPIASELEPLDVVAWTSAHNGYENKKFLVTEIEDEPSYLQALDIQELDPADYSYDAATEEQPHSVGPVGIDRPPPQVIFGFSVEPAIIYDSAGEPRRPGVRFRWDKDIEDVRAVAFELRNPATGQTILSDSTDMVGNGSALVTSAAILPAQLLEGRGKYLPRGARATDWTGWIPVTTDEILLGEFDLYEGAIDIEHLSDAIKEWRNWISEGTRELIADVQQSFMLIGDQDIRKFEDVQQLKREAKVQKGELTAAYKEEITTAIGTVNGVTTALSQRVETVEVALPGKASVAVTNALGSRLTFAEGQISLQGSSITSIRSELTGKANVTAVNAMDTRINETNGVVTAQGNLINSISAQVGEATADANLRAEVRAAPAGYSSRIGLEARIGAVGNYRSASLFIDVPSSVLLPTRVAVVADQFVVDSGYNTGNFRAFLVQDGVVYLDNARVRGLTADKISVASLSALSANLGNVSVAGNLVVEGSLQTGKFASQAVSKTETFDAGGTVDISSWNGSVEVARATVWPEGGGGNRVTVDFTATVYALWNGPSNWGSFEARLYENGFDTGRTCIARPDDENQDGLFVIRSMISNYGNTPVTFTVLARYIASPGPGSNIGCRNRFMTLNNQKK